MSSNMNQEVIQQQAATYVARLYSGELSAEEEMQIYVWCDRSPEHQQEFDSMLAIWDTSNQLFQTAQPNKNKKKNKKNAYWLTSIAASLVCTVLVMWYLTLPGPAPLYQAAIPKPNTYHTAIGEISTVGLPDGSAVTLNTDSAIRINFTGQQRRVWLERGEAFFDVAKDESRIFSINTGEKTIRVIGTKFNVRKSDATLKVSVTEGLVAIQPSALPSSEHIDFEEAETLLPAGSVGAFNGTSEVITHVTSKEVLANQQWRQGIFRFNNEPLANVITEFNRYRLKKITLQNRDLGKLKISGVFKLKDGDSILSALEAALPVEIDRYPEYIELSARN